ncbi:MAG: 4-hydroxy-3-methylbut-2-enyl diphosphate reductase [Pyramidobacter sp.]|nr:4-hydroxy-3-methylbut-2-enyl diphosphate reductase [Pyramidobacter sp.]
MRIITAEPTGLCFGVRRAIQTVEHALSEGRPVYGLGSPIHNPQEVARLERLGLIVVDSEGAVPEGSTVFIRAHGVSPQVMEHLAAKNVTVIDGTCPFVRVVQNRAKELSDAGYHLLILGDAKHPEIAGILGYVSGQSTVISSVSSSTIFTSSGKIRKLGLVSQTTQEERVLAEVAACALQAADELRVYNTICRSTIERQNAVKKLASAADGIIVIGGHDSANTGKLYRIAQDSGCDVLWIEHADQLDRGWVLEKGVIGIAAGASTPDWLIEQLKNAIKSIAGRQGDVNNE